VSRGKDKREAAQKLFALLREMDDLGVKAIFSEAVDENDIGLAVMNRMGRAAAFNIIKV
jgi:L-threonylcarbamoyladenylate synthase